MSEEASSQYSADFLRSVGKCCIVIGVIGGVILPSSICAIITGSILAGCKPAKEMKLDVMRGAKLGIVSAAIEYASWFIYCASGGATVYSDRSYPLPYQTWSIFLYFGPLGVRTLKRPGCLCRARASSDVTIDGRAPLSAHV